MASSTENSRTGLGLGETKNLTFKISKFMMGMVLTDRLNFIKDNKALNKGGDSKKREKVNIS